MPATGPDSISLQARDLGASQAFYEQYLGLVRSQAGPPHAVVFETKPIAFALRDVVPGTDLASVAQPGIGAAIWLHATTSRPFTMLSSPTVAPSSPHRLTAPSVGHSPSPTPTATRSLSTTAPDRPNATGRSPFPEDRGCARGSRIRATFVYPGVITCPA